jgi:hypothetical protein
MTLFSAFDRERIFMASAGREFGNFCATTERAAYNLD